MTLPQKNVSRIKTPSSKSLILYIGVIIGGILLEKNFLRINALINFDLVPDFFEISDRGCHLWATLYSCDLQKAWSQWF